MSKKDPITPEGHARFQAELERLWREERPKIVNEVADAAALGDRSENAEYIYGKKRLREIDRRMRYLNGLLERVRIVDPKTVSSDRVEFGATVTIEDEEGRRRTYQIVGVEEVDAKEGRISSKSPVGKALMNKKVGDIVVVERPIGDLEMELVDIRYV
jgi:transcription elongation factor GreB